MDVSPNDIGLLLAFNHSLNISSIILFLHIKKYVDNYKEVEYHKINHFIIVFLLFRR